MAHQKSAELTEPSVGALGGPAALVSSQFAAVFVLSELVVLAASTMRSMSHLASRSRSGSARAATTRFGFCLGRPFGRGL